MATRPRDVRDANLPLGTCQVSPGGVWDAGSALRRRVPGLIPRERRSPAGVVVLTPFRRPNAAGHVETWEFLPDTVPGELAPQQGGFVVKRLTLMSGSLSSSPSSGIIWEEIPQLFLIPSAKREYHSQPHRAEGSNEM